MVFKERPNYLNDIEAIKEGVLKGKIRHKDIMNYVRTRKQRIEQLKKEIEELIRMDEELIKRF